MTQSMVLDWISQATHGSVHLVAVLFALLVAALVPLWLLRESRHSAAGQAYQQFRRTRSIPSCNGVLAVKGQQRLANEAPNGEQSARSPYEELLHRLHGRGLDAGLADVGGLLGAIVQEGFKEPSCLSPMCEAGLAHALGLVLRHLTTNLLGAHGLDSERHFRLGRQTADDPYIASVVRKERIGLDGSDSLPPVKCLGTACLQASWLLVQLTAGTASTKRAVLAGVTVRTLAAFMRSLAPAELVTCCIYGCEGDCASGPAQETNCIGCSAASKELRAAMLRRQPRLLPQALLDAVLRNCSWSLLQLCDTESSLHGQAPLQQSSHDGGGAAAAISAQEGSEVLPNVAVPIAVGLSLLPGPPCRVEPAQLGDGCMAFEHPSSQAAGPSCSETAGYHECAPSDVLVRLVQCWEGLEAALAAGAVLSSIALLEDAAPQLAARARARLLGPHTLGQLAEALCRAGTVDRLARDGACPPSAAADAAASQPSAAASVLSRPVGRPCALLSRFFSRTLSSPVGAVQLLRQAVADHAVSWLLHAPALPLPLRRQLLRQLLGSEGQGVLAANSTQTVDGSLALCHVISAPPKCHSLLAPDVAGYMLAAAPFGLAPVHGVEGPAVAALQEPHAYAAGGPEADLHPAVLPDPAWGMGAPQLHVQAPVAVGQQAAAFWGAGQDALAPFAAPDAEAPGRCERPLSTLAAACRLLLAGGRLDTALAAFFADLRASRCASEPCWGPGSSFCSDTRSPFGPDSAGNSDWVPAALAATLGSGSGGSSNGQYLTRDMLTAALVRAGSSTALLRGDSSIIETGGERAPAAEASAPSPSVGGRTTPGLTEEGIMIGYRRSGSDSSLSGEPGSGGSKGSQAQSHGVLTDVMAGVAGLIDAMMWRSASLGNVRGMRGSGVDHLDSMSETVTESLTVAAGGHCEGSSAGSSGQGGHGGACPAAAAAVPAAPPALPMNWEAALEAAEAEHTQAQSAPVGSHVMAGVRAAVSARASVPFVSEPVQRFRRPVIDVRSGGLGRAEGSETWAGVIEADIMTVEAEGGDEGAAQSAAAPGISSAAAWLSSSTLSMRTKRVSAPAGSADYKGPAVGGSSQGSSGMRSHAGLDWQPVDPDSAGPDAARPGMSCALRSGGGGSRSAEAAFCVNGSSGGSLQPYTYFGATHLTAAALAVSPGVTKAAASRLSNSGRGPNSAAQEIAVAAAAAAAAAAANVDSAGGTTAARTAASAVLCAKAASAASAREAGFGAYDAWVAGSGVAPEFVQDQAPQSSTQQFLRKHITPHGYADLPDDNFEGFLHDEEHRAGSARHQAFEDYSPFATLSAPPAPALLASASAQRPGTAAARTAAGGTVAPAAASGNSAPLACLAGGHQEQAQDAAVVEPLLHQEALLHGAPAVGSWQTGGTGGTASEAPAVPSLGVWSSALSSDGTGVIFSFGSEQVEVTVRAFRFLRRCSPLLYGWLSRLPNTPAPITIVQVPGLDAAANSRVFHSLLGWAQGVRDVGQLLHPEAGQQRGAPGEHWGAGEGLARSASNPVDVPNLKQQPAPLGKGDRLSLDSSRGPPGVPALQQLKHLWRAADYLQVDELLVAVEDELGRRFAQPGPAGLAAWCAALRLAASQRHASSRLAGLCALHFMRHVWALLGDEETRGAAGGAAGVLGPAVTAELRDRLVALVALSDQDLTGGE